MKRHSRLSGVRHQNGGWMPVRAGNSGRKADTGQNSEVDTYIMRKSIRFMVSQKGFLWLVYF